MKFRPFIVRVNRAIGVNWFLVPLKFSGSIGRRTQVINVRRRFPTTRRGTIPYGRRAAGEEALARREMTARRLASSSEVQARSLPYLAHSTFLSGKQRRMPRSAVVFFIVVVVFGE